MRIVDSALLHKRHRNEKVFMIGAGPSLTTDMLDQLVGYSTIAMNNISVAFPHTEWRPTYYVNVNIVALRWPHNARCSREAIRVAKHSFIWSKSIGLLSGIDGNPSVSILSCHKFPEWSWRIDRWVSKYGSSMFTALQIAAFLGFRKIYLLGCDLNYTATFDEKTLEDGSHFSDDYMSDRARKARADNMEKSREDEMKTYFSHELAYINTCKRNIHIKTCSPALEKIYPYVSFEEAISEQVESKIRVSKLPATWRSV